MNGRNRIPDGFDQNMWVQEVKNVKSQSLTTQLKDDFIYAAQNKIKNGIICSANNISHKAFARSNKIFWSNS